MKKTISWLCGLALCSAALSTFAAPNVAPAEELKQLLQQGQSLKGNFDQKLFDRERNLLQATEGEFVVQRPGNFYWETLPPYEQIVVGNSDTLWVYDPDLEQVTVHDQRQQQQSSPAQILSGDLEGLSKQYDIKRKVDGQDIHFILISKSDDAMFERLTLGYQQGALTALEFEDKLGQVTELRFSDTTLNPKVDPSLFQFKVPEGVDVIIDD